MFGAIRIDRRVGCEDHHLILATPPSSVPASPVVVPAQRSINDDALELDHHLPAEQVRAPNRPDCSCRYTDGGDASTMTIVFLGRPPLTCREAAKCRKEVSLLGGGCRLGRAHPKRGPGAPRTRTANHFSKSSSHSPSDHRYPSFSSCFF